MPKEPTASADQHCIKRPDDETEAYTPDQHRIGPGRQWTIASPVTVPMPDNETQQLIRAWAVLIATWWTTDPPDQP